jgi:hypothetical protein
VIVWSLNAIDQARVIEVDLLKELKCLSFSSAGNLLLTCGIDAKKRDILIIWDLSDPIQTTVFAK